MTTTETIRPEPSMLRCQLPEMNVDGLRVERFTVEPDALENLRLMMAGRYCKPGEYTKLVVDGTLWMSDTTAEQWDHWPALVAASNHPGGRGLVHGLGLGCIVSGFLNYLDHVDVVEKDPRVAEHIGGWFTQTYPGRVTIHEGDAYTFTFPKGTTWDVAWHDIWADVSTDDLVLMAKMNRRYARRVKWQGCWAQKDLQRSRDRERRSGGWGW